MSYFNRPISDELNISLGIKIEHTLRAVHKLIIILTDLHMIGQSERNERLPDMTPYTNTCIVIRYYYIVRIKKNKSKSLY